MPKATHSFGSLLPPGQAGIRSGFCGGSSGKGPAWGQHSTQASSAGLPGAFSTHPAGHFSGMRWQPLSRGTGVISAAEAAQKIAGSRNSPPAIKMARPGCCFRACP